VFSIAYRGEADPPQTEKAWPLPVPLSSFGTPGAAGFRCGVVEGADLDTLRKPASESNEATPWTSDQKRYQLVFRPLLPDETGCPPAA
jgi:hypothetical protein